MLKADKQALKDDITEGEKERLHISLSILGLPKANTDGSSLWFRQKRLFLYYKDIKYTFLYILDSIE